MAKVKCDYKYQAFSYDFAVDGGAIGPISTGLFFPDNTQLIGCNLFQIADLTSGGAAVVNIGFGGGELIDNAAMGVVGNFDDYNIGAYGFGITMANTSSFGFYIPAFSNGLNAANELTLDVSAFALTGGQFNCVVFYVVFN